jgi:hypothetical protein
MMIIIIIIIIIMKKKNKNNNKKKAATVAADTNGESLGSEEKYQQNAPPNYQRGRAELLGSFRLG